jgi:predicted Holliday junction resolvase-like endonuclease
MQFGILALISITELVLFIMLLRFFSRLRKSENVYLRLAGDQRALMEKLQANAALERELVQSFAVRQAELQKLDKDLEKRAGDLRALLEQAERVGRSPQFLRGLIRSGSRQGRSPAQLARATGLSLDEVQLILAQEEN